MENTGSLLFPNDAPVWFLARGEGRFSGPFTGADLLREVKSGGATWTDYVMKSGQSEFRRLSEIPDFQPFLPQAPTSADAGKIQAQIKSLEHAMTQTKKGPPVPPPLSPPATAWFLYRDQAQYGPFPESEIRRLYSIGRADSTTHAWRDGMDTWLRLDQIDEFRELFAKGKEDAPPSRVSTEPEPPRDKRSAPRRPLVARVIVTDQKKVSSGLCRDISIGGMQVLTDLIPGKVGDQIRLNVSQAGDPSIPPFVAEGEIVRILEDGRGFSFRFLKLDDSVRTGIERFIRT